MVWSRWLLGLGLGTALAAPSETPPAPQEEAAPEVPAEQPPAPQEEAAPEVPAEQPPAPQEEAAPEVPAEQPPTPPAEEQPPEEPAEQPAAPPAEEQPPAPPAEEQPPASGQTVDAEAAADVLGPDELDVWAEGKISTELNHAEFDIPVEINPYVMQWLKYWTGPGRPTYATWMIRAQRWRPTLHQLLQAEGAPKDMVYLAMIESGYSNSARSWAGAVGMWQFIRSTGRSHGLKINRWVDERRDPVKATRAAARFLRELYGRYHNWHLAMAAYNCGPGCVDGAVRGYGTTDFWTLVKRRALPQETMHYVPKILAAAIIGHHPQRYGFSDLQNQSRAAPIWPSVEVDASIGLDVVAGCYKTDQATMERLNPQLIEWALPPDGTALDIHVPLETQGASDCLRRLR